MRRHFFKSCLHRYNKHFLHSPFMHYVIQVVSTLGFSM